MDNIHYIFAVETDSTKEISTWKKFKLWIVWGYCFLKFVLSIGIIIRRWPKLEIEQCWETDKYLARIGSRQHVYIRWPNENGKVIRI